MRSIWIGCVDEIVAAQRLYHAVGQHEAGLAARRWSGSACKRRFADMIVADDRGLHHVGQMRVTSRAVRK